MTLSPGMFGEASTIVTSDLTAAAIGSGLLPVYATPAMISLLEQAAALAVQSALPGSQTTVGTKVNVEHLAASPIGARIHAKAQLTAVDGRRLTFAVEVWDDTELIGRGNHERFVVEKERFVTRAAKKGIKTQE